VIKVLAPALRHPDNRRLPEFHNYWGETHGPLFCNTKNVRRYVQHLTLPEAYGGDPKPTFDGVSMFWYDDYEGRRMSSSDPELRGLLEDVLGIEVGDRDLGEGDPQVAALLLAVLKDDAQLFDRSTSWPMHHKTAAVAAEEHVIVDGETTPEMVKAIFIYSKLPGLTLHRFLDRWENHLGPLVSGIPGLRRYVQNHALPDAYVTGGQTHDGWGEVWFDDLESLQRAWASDEWQAVRDEADTLFADPVGVGIARERIQKDLDWSYNDWGAPAMTEDEIRERLAAQGYATLAADADAPRKIKAAAEAQALAVWTHEHLVTIDDSRIDERPER
jgi:uncharacterized protein (TIGR02118 family)